jgi:hypothetical protein
MEKEAAPKEQPLFLCKYPISDIPANNFPIFAHKII